MRLYQMAFGFQGRQPCCPRRDSGSAGKIYRVAGAPDVSRLMRHGSQYLGAERGITGGTRHPKRLYEISLRKPMLFHVIGRPSRQLRQLGRGREQFAANSFRVAPA